MVVPLLHIRIDKHKSGFLCLSVFLSLSPVSCSHDALSRFYTAYTIIPISMTLLSSFSELSTNLSAVLDLECLMTSISRSP